MKMIRELQIELEEILSELPIHVIAVNLQESPDGVIFAGIHAIVTGDSWSSNEQGSTQ